MEPEQEGFDWDAAKDVVGIGLIVVFVFVVLFILVRSCEVGSCTDSCQDEGFDYGYLPDDKDGCVCLVEAPLE